MIKNILRGVMTLDIDDDCKIVIMKPQKDEHFTSGTDFKTLLYHKKNNQFREITEYFNDLYGLHSYMAKMNKPLIALAPGKSYNSGAAFLQACGCPMTYPNSRVAFNDVCYGFVPHGGSSYYLSRLKGEAGTFLALTGLTIPGSDAYAFNLADSMVNHDNMMAARMRDGLVQFSTPYLNQYWRTDRFTQDTPWKQHLKNIQKTKEDMEKLDQNSRQRQKLEGFFNEEFEDPEGHRPSLVANADYEYKKQLQKLSDAKTGGVGYLDGVIPGEYTNFYKIIMDHCLYANDPQPFDSQGVYFQQMDIINRCFYPNSVEQIMHLLEQERSAFAQLCLKRMKSNSMLSMKITLKMLRDARNKDLRSAMLTEINVGLNKIQGDDFDLGVQEVLIKPAEKDIKDPGYKKDISNETVEKHFEHNKFMEKVNLDIVENTLLPQRFYYNTFTDQVRLWINDASTPQDDVREFFDYELKEALREQGIDIRDRALTLEMARKLFFQRELLQRNLQAFKERAQTFASDEKLRENAYKQLQDQIKKIEELPDKEFYQKVNNSIEKVFEEAYLDKMKTIYNKSAEVHKLIKRRMFLSFKKFLFRKRILSYDTSEMIMHAQQAASFPFKEVHLSERWDQSFRTMNHPDIDKSPLYHIAKTVGRVDLTPLELTKEYIINGKMPKMMQLFTFDVEELKKLRRDLIENTQKYIDIFMRPDRVPTYIPVYDIEDKTLKDEYKHWWMIRNKTQLSHTDYEINSMLKRARDFTEREDINFFRELEAYKDFVRDIDRRTIDTLKLMVNKLIIDLETEKVKEFEQLPNETNREALLKLYSLMNNKEERLTKKVQKDKLTNLRDIKDIEKGIKQLINKDEDLKMLFTIEKGNKLINQLQGKLQEELYKLIELVLIHRNKHNTATGKDLLKQRYKQGASSIQLIDEYLKTYTNQEELLKIVALVKPFYLEQVKTILEEECTKLLKGFKFEKTSKDVLSYYLLSLRIPNLKDFQVMNKIHNYNANRNKIELFDKKNPTLSRNYQYKVFLKNMGKDMRKDIEGKTVEEIEKYEEEETKRELGEYQKMQDEDKELENLLDEQVQTRQERNKNFKVQKNSYKKEVYQKTPEANPLIYNQDEQKDLLDIQTQIDLNSKLIYDTPIHKNISNSEWVHYYSSAIKHHGMIFPQVLKHLDNTTSEQVDYSRYENTNTMGQQFPQTKDMKWEDYADYGEYLTRYYHLREKLSENSRDFDSQFESMKELIAGSTTENSPTAMGIFDHILTRPLVQDKKEKLKTSIQDLVNSEKEKAVQDKQKRNIAKLIRGASLTDNQRQIIEDIYETESKYVNYAVLEKLLIKREYDKVTPSEVLDHKKIVSDFSQGQSSDAFMKEYYNTPLDVLSIAEFKSLLKSKEVKVIPQSQADLMAIVLDDIQEKLIKVSNSRRSDMKLGEFVKQYYQVDSNLLTEFTSSLIKTQIEKILGEQGEGENIIYTHDKFISHPFTLQEEANKQIQFDAEKLKTPFLQRDIKTEIKEILERIRFNDQRGQLLGDWTKEMNKLQLTAEKIFYLRKEFEPIRAYYENNILHQYIKPQVDQEKINELIQAYSQKRIQECLYTKEFQEVIKGPQAPLYIQILKEKILDELNASTPVKLLDISYNKLQEIDNLGEQMIKVDGIYNTQSISNFEQMGYENFEERLKDIQNSQDAAYSSPLDQLMSQYFLDKRKEVQATKNMVRDLDQVFQNRMYDDSNPHKTGDRKQFNHKGPRHEKSATNPLNVFDEYHKSGQNKFKVPGILQQDFYELMNLDIATQQAIEEGLNGLRAEHREIIRDQIEYFDGKSDRSKVGKLRFKAEIPMYFDRFDVRKPLDKWVEDRLYQVIKDVFDMRSKIETSMTRKELIAYDQKIAEVLNRENIIERLYGELAKEFSQLRSIQHLVDREEDGEADAEIQRRKVENATFLQNRNTDKNPDNLYKFVAWQMMWYDYMKKHPKETVYNERFVFWLDHFRNYYQDNLMERAEKGEPLPDIDPKDYLPNQEGKVAPGQEGASFMTVPEKKEKFFVDFEKYQKELSYEKHHGEFRDRAKVYMILESLSNQAQKSIDPLSTAQEEIMNFFKNPANIRFYDKDLKL